MQFFLNKDEKVKINKLIETCDYNDSVASFLNEEVINEDLDEEFKQEYDIQELNLNDYLHDEYYQSVQVNVKRQHYQLKNEQYRAYQCFIYDDIDVDEDDYFLIKNHVGYFTKAYSYLTLQKQNVIWMSVIPHEMNTMKKLANDVSGHVYVLGLGLAYYPNLISERASKITIVEKDENIINIFKELILPKLKHQEKYELIQADAFDYAREHITNEDIVFADLWHNPIDGLEDYVHLKRIFKDNLHVRYWIEESLLASIRHLFINLIEEELYHPGEFSYEANDRLEDALINKLHQYCLNKKITSYEDIKKLLTSKSLKKIIAFI